MNKPGVNNGETYIFVEASGKNQFSVKVGFLDECPNPENFTTLELFQTYRMGKFIHNPNGPARLSLTRPKDHPFYAKYWIDAELLSEEQIVRLEHNIEFRNKLEDAAFED